MQYFAQFSCLRYLRVHGEWNWRPWSAMLSLASLFYNLNDLLLALHAVINIELTEVNLFKKVKTAYQVEIFTNSYFTWKQDAR